MTGHAGRGASDCTDREAPGQRHHRGATSRRGSRPWRHRAPCQGRRDAAASHRRVPARSGAADPDGPSSGGGSRLWTPMPLSATAQPPVFMAFCPRPTQRCRRHGRRAKPVAEAGDKTPSHRGPRDQQDATVMRGLRITTIARTVCDLAATESARATEQAFQEALYRRIVTTRAIEAVIAREPTRRGSPDHPGAARRPPPHPLREGTQDPQADRPGPAPEAPHERPRPRLPGRRLLALTRSRPRVRRLGRPRPPAGVREQPQA